MKIAHLIPTLGKGGAERVVVDLANQQARDGHAVTVTIGSKVDERLLRHELGPDIQVEYISSGHSRPARYVAGLRWVVRRANWLGEQDILHAHMSFSALLATLVFWWRGLSGARKPRIIETYHAVGMTIPRWQRWLHARMAERRDGLILMAQDDYWSKFTAGQPSLKSRMIPNGLARPQVRDREDPAALAYAAAAGLPADRTFTVGTIGRLVPARQPSLYLPPFANIARELGPQVHFLMAGEGPERSAVETLASSLGMLRQFHLPGLARDASLPRALIDLYVTVNVGSVTGLSGLEAAYCGIPVIAIQLLDGRRSDADDWIWSSADGAAVAAEAIRLLRDPSALGELGRRQQAHVSRHHGIAAMSAAYEDFYRSAGAVR